MKTIKKTFKLDPSVIRKRRKAITRLWIILRRDYDAHI